MFLGVPKPFPSRHGPVTDVRGVGCRVHGEWGGGRGEGEW